MTKTRTMRVSYATDGSRVSGEEAKPMIRIANFFLRSSGFKFGSRFSVEYGEGSLLIKLLPAEKADTHSHGTS